MNSCDVYKVICLGLPEDHWCSKETVLKTGGIYWLYLPKIGEGSMYFFGIDDVWYGDLSIMDCVYFREVGVYRDDRINEILE